LSLALGKPSERPAATIAPASRVETIMSVKVYGINHIAIEVDDIEKAVEFYQDVFNLQKLDEGEGDAFFKLGEHQFLAMFAVDRVQPSRVRHFGLMVRDEAQLAEVREKLTKRYGIKLIPPFRCDFFDPFGNRVQVVDLHDESLIWLLPYQEIQKAGLTFNSCC
jgi:catechol 2,3-dioxygenase-like lactoylglutathione lyase family enzyme